MSEIIPSNGPDEGDNPEWAVIAEPAGMEQAGIIVSSLKAAGIPAWIERESAGSALGLSVGLLGRIWVLVPLEYQDQALDILAGDFEAVGDDDYDDYMLDENENIIYIGSASDEASTEPDELEESDDGEE